MLYLYNDSYHKSLALSIDKSDSISLPNLPPKFLIFVKGMVSMKSDVAESLKIVFQLYTIRINFELFNTFPFLFTCLFGLFLLEQSLATDL